MSWLSDALERVGVSKEIQRKLTPTAADLTQYAGSKLQQPIAKSAARLAWEKWRGYVFAFAGGVAVVWLIRRSK